MKLKSYLVFNGNAEEAQKYLMGRKAISYVIKIVRMKKPLLATKIK